MFTSWLLIVVMWTADEDMELHLVGTFSSETMCGNARDIINEENVFPFEAVCYREERMRWPL